MLKRALFVLLACAPLGLILGGCQPVQECAQDADCTADDQNLCDNGACVECIDDQDCPQGETCTGGACGGQDQCDANDDCDAGEVCENGDCVPDGGSDPAAAGQAFYTGNGCNVCHGAQGQGDSAPNIQDATAEEIFDNIGGADPHDIKVQGATTADAANVAAFLASF